MDHRHPIPPIIEAVFSHRAEIPVGNTNKFNGLNCGLLCFGQQAAGPKDD